MPSHVTYGKKKKNTILSLFPVLTDEGNSLTPSKSKSGKRVSATISMKAFYGSHDNDPDKNNSSALDDSIEEMASMLLDETTMNQLAGEPGKRLSKLGSAKILPQPPQQAFFHDKSLPQLPQLSFGGDNEWPTKSNPLTTTAEVSTDGDPLGYEEECDSCPPPVSRQPAHLRKTSAPSLPRKSSKRTSRQREGKNIAEAHSSRADNKRQLEPRKLSKITQQHPEGQSPLIKDGPHKTDSPALPDISKQIEAMIVASRTLKPQGDSFMTGSPVAPKRSGIKGTGVLSKMKTALTERFQEKGLKKHQYFANSERLLDPSLSQLPEYDEEASTISAMELRINEGVNFGNRKIQSLTGHGTIRRKPVADDGKSLISRKSGDIPSPEDVRSTGTRAMYSFDNRRKSNLSLDQTADCLPPLRTRLHQVRDEVLRIPSAQNLQSSFEVDFDALFSSSPVAQSTPRIRLEPTFEDNGSKKLRNVPADSHSLFDPDSSVCRPPSDSGVTTTPLRTNTTRKTIVKRNNSQVKEIGLGVKAHVSKRRKKHPSPSKTELEGLEDALKHYSPRVEPVDAKTHEDLTQNSRQLQAREVLQSKNNNAPLSQAAKRGKASRLGMFGRAKEPATGSSMAEPARRPVVKLVKPSMIPKPAGAPTMKRRADSRMYLLKNQNDGSAMDTDELQWDSTEYHIGMKG